MVSLLSSRSYSVARWVSVPADSRQVGNAIHLRTVHVYAEGSDGTSRPKDRRQDGVHESLGSRKNGSAPILNLKRLDSIDIEDGEALESARADSEIPISRLKHPSSVGSEYSLRSSLDPLDPEVHEAELSSISPQLIDTPKESKSPQLLPSSNQNPTPSNVATVGTSSQLSSKISSSDSTTSRTSLPSQASSRPAYRPRTPLSLARRRMLAQYLPFPWQQSLRRSAEDIPEQQFNYLLSTFVIAGTALASGAAAWLLWPFCREVVNFIFSADAVEARVLQELTFETQYLAAISLVTAILFGNTFAFSFDRQRQIIQEMAEEIFALELLLQELFIDVPEPHLRWRVIKNIKRYIDNEIQARDIDSPFRVDGAIVGLFDALVTLRDEGRNITKLLVSVEMLAQANSRRGALAAALLPPLHWVMLGALCLLLLSAFLLFDSDFSNPVAENRAIFAVLSAMLVTILQVLRDISSPDDGLYSVRDALETRLTYVRWQMDNILSDATIKVSMLSKEETEAIEESVDGDAESSADTDPAIKQPPWMRE